LTVFESAAVKTFVPRFWRIYFASWLISLCRLPATPALTLPLAVTLKRFLAPDFVFNFGIFHAEPDEWPRPLGSVTNRHGMPWARRFFESGRRYGKTGRNATGGVATAARLRLGYGREAKGATMSSIGIGVAATVALFGVAAASGPAPAQDAPSPITVQLTDYRYSPTEIDLTHGQSYVLHVVNPGGGGHDLSARAFFQAVTLAPDSAALVHDGDIEVKGGQSVDIAFTAGAPGTYEMHCTHPMHAMFGMKGKIVVQ
jgi:uncharacterized cupredoxin-like copper-binding protein